MCIRDRTQAHNKLISESRSYRVAAGVEGTATADSLMAKNAISKLTSASMIEGTDLEKHNAIATPLKEAIKLLNDMKARNGDAESIAKLEAAIAAAPEKLLSDADIAKAATGVPFMITNKMKQQLFDLGYTEAVSYTHLRAHETPEQLVCRLLLEKKKQHKKLIKKYGP